MYKGALKSFRETKPVIDINAKHEELQLLPEQGIIDWDVAKDGPIPLCTNNQAITKYLNDPRFKFCDNLLEAKVIWTIDSTMNWQELGVD